MSDEESPSDKEHDATQQKLSEARRKGEIARSADLTTAASYLGFVLAIVAFGGTPLIKAGTSAAVLLGQADRLSQSLLSGAGNNVAGLVAAFATALAPFFLLPAIAALAMVALQRALIFTPSRLAPKLSRISPIAGAANKFGRKGLFEFGKSFVKLLVTSGLLLGFLMYQATDFLHMIYLSPALSTAMLLEKSVGFLALVAMIALAIGGIDYFWQRSEHLRANRMSRKEVMDEHKNSEGDPHMKAKRRQKAQEIATSQMLVDVARADVVIVNPTHYAVALRWDRATGRAPVCVAKGVDEIAARIRERASEHGVPLHSDPPTARLLYATMKIGEELHPDHYRAVAAAIRFADAMRQKMRESRWGRA